MSYRALSARALAIAHRLGWLPLILLPLLLLAGRAWAQPSNGGPEPPAAVPLDGGATLALAAGAAYGLRRLRRAGR